MKINNFKTNIYDFLGYFLPGAVVILQIFLIFNDFNIVVDKIRKLSSGEIFLIIIFSYIIGHLIQSFSNILEKILLKIPIFKKIVGLPTHESLLERNNFYSIEFKKSIREAGREVFGIEKLTEKEFFNLCYSLVQQKLEKNRLNLFVSLYGFYRGLSYSCLIGFVLFVIKFDFIISGIFLVSSILFFQRYKRFKSYFEDYVYRDFYIYYLTDYKNHE